MLYVNIARMWPIYYYRRSVHIGDDKLNIGLRIIRNGDTCTHALAQRFPREVLATRVWREADRSEVHVACSQPRQYIHETLPVGEGLGTPVLVEYPLIVSFTTSHSNPFLFAVYRELAIAPSNYRHCDRW